MRDLFPVPRTQGNKVTILKHARIQAGMSGPRRCRPVALESRGDDQLLPFGINVTLVDLKLPARLELDLGHELVLAPFAADHATPPCA